MDWSAGVRAVGYLGAGLLAGGVVEVVVFRWLGRWLAGRFGRYGQILLRALRGAALVLATGLGAYAAVLSLPIGDGVKAPLGTAVRVCLTIEAVVVFVHFASQAIAQYVERQSGRLASSTIVVNIARAVIITVGVLMVLQVAGITIAPLLTTLGIGGLAVALALQDTLGNIFAGIYIILSKKFLPGDYVRLETGEEGVINDITWSSTSIQTADNNMVIAPNSLLTSNRITNYERPSSDLSFGVPVGVHYDSDLNHVEQVTLDVARETLREVDGAAEDFEPYLRFNAFADRRIDCTVFLGAKAYRYQFAIRHEFIKRLHRRYRAEGIVIPFALIEPDQARDAPGRKVDGR
jgi:small-conductance mechanosensitive channel